MTELTPEIRAGMTGKAYRGFIDAAGSCRVVVVTETALEKRERELDPRLDLVNHSPTGFAWGYLGSGPSQLACALLADALEDDETAKLFYQNFKEAFVARLPQEATWRIQAAGVFDWLRKFRCLS